MTHIDEHPLEFYVGKLLRREPFASLLYGDGELLVAAGTKLGSHYTHYRELVTPKMVEEMRASLTDPAPDVIRGTEPFIINPETYGGRDVEMVKAAAAAVRPVVEGVAWADGVVWDREVRAGRLATLLRVLHDRRLAVVANPQLREAWFLHPKVFVEAPPTNAYGAIDRVEQALAGTDFEVLVCCAGLLTVPLIMRLRRRFPQRTYLDLGSVLDVFVGLGSERGWRREAYADKVKYGELVAANLDGVCGADCGTYLVAARPYPYYVERGKVAVR